MSVAFGVVALFVLTAATGYFVAQEFAYVAADRARLTHAAGQGDAKAQRALQIMGRLSFMLSGAQLGITVTGLIVGFLAKPALAELLDQPLTWVGVPEGAVGPVALALGFMIATIVQMVLGELFPKNWALARAEPLARALATSTLVYLTVTGPVIRLFDATANRLLRAVGIEPAEELHHGATLEELSLIIGESHRAGHMPADLSALLERALTFRERTADQVMVPRPSLQAVAGDGTVAELTELVRRSGHTSYPVYGTGVDDVVGMTHVRDAILAENGERATDVAYLVPALEGGTTVLDAAGRLQRAHAQLAVVNAEDGTFQGIVSLDDLLSQLLSANPH